MWRSHYYRAKGADHELRVESRKFWPESSSSNADLLVTETTIVDGGMRIGKIGGGSVPMPSRDTLHEAYRVPLGTYAAELKKWKRRQAPKPHRMLPPRLRHVDQLRADIAAEGGTYTEADRLTMPDGFLSDALVVEFKNGEALLEAPPSPCIKCDTAAEYFDALGRLYCAKHGTER